MDESKVEKKLRFRVNVSISAKGQKTWECTVDGEGYDMYTILQESDALVKELDLRYPPSIA